jgi:hypothetical protein
MAFPTIADRADRSAGPLSPLPCKAWHGYGVSNAHYGEVSECRRACERTPLRGRRSCAAGGRRLTHNLVASKAEGIRVYYRTKWESEAHEVNEDYCVTYRLAYTRK